MDDLLKRADRAIEDGYLVRDEAVEHRPRAPRSTSYGSVQSQAPKEATNEQIESMFFGLLRLGSEETAARVRKRLLFTTNK